MKEIEKYEVLLKQRLKALDNQTVLRVIEGALSEASPAPHNTQEIKHHNSQDVRLYLLEDIEQEHFSDSPIAQLKTEYEIEEEFEIYGEY